MYVMPTEATRKHWDPIELVIDACELPHMSVKKQILVLSNSTISPELPNHFSRTRTTLHECFSGTTSYDFCLCDIRETKPSTHCNISTYNMQIIMHIRAST